MDENSMHTVHFKVFVLPYICVTMRVILRERSSFYIFKISRVEGR